MDNNINEKETKENIKYNWLLRKTPRSVDNLKLWPDNPRLNPEESHLTLRDFAEDLTSEIAEKDSFYNLIRSIVEDGFVPADPIVVWKNPENDKYYVAEGNRRVTALKLLRNPSKAPKSIRSFIRSESKKIDLNSIEKIYVNVAPTFEDALWYINQRNSSSSLQRKWSRIQQQRWISTLYEKFSGDIETILKTTKLDKSEVESFIRILKIKDFIKNPIVKNKLSTEEFEKANSHKFPITILERIFAFSEVKQQWGIEFDGIEIKIISDQNSFYNLFGELIKRIVNNNDDRINTRLKKEDLPQLFSSLPEVTFNNASTNENTDNVNNNDVNGEQQPDPESKRDESENEVPNNKRNNRKTYSKGDPERTSLILPCYEINTDSYRLLGLFNELKKLSLKYNNSVAASIRVFLDLAVYKHIATEDLTSDLQKHYKEDIKSITLKKRLEYLKQNNLQDKQRNIVSKLLDPATEFSLDVLNGFVHSQDTHYLNKNFLNRFWDFLFPLFQHFLDIREK